MTVLLNKSTDMLNQPLPYTTKDRAGKQECQSSRQDPGDPWIRTHPLLTPHPRTLPHLPFLQAPPMMPLKLQFMAFSVGGSTNNTYCSFYTYKEKHQSSPSVLLHSSDLPSHHMLPPETYTTSLAFVGQLGAFILPPRPHRGPSLSPSPWTLPFLQARQGARVRA